MSGPGKPGPRAVGPDAALAIIGGTGFRPPPGASISSEWRGKTPWGRCSGAIALARCGGARVLFLQRHGSHGAIAPHAINYRANVHALWQLGARRIIAVNAVGGISPEMADGCIVIPDQIIDYTGARAHSFHNAGPAPLQYADFSAPYCETLRQALLQAGQRAGLAPVLAGVHGVSQGPRLETRAEIRRMARDGCDIVGMTGMPEAALARELDCAYACCALVVNQAAGTAPLDLQQVQENLRRGMKDIHRLLEQLLEAEAP